MTWDRDDKERTAFHEAGHAVVAWSFGVIVGCIHLDLKNESGHAMIGPATHLKPIEQIANWYAGREAEKAFKFPANPHKSKDDLFRVGQILDEHTPGETRERQDLRERGRACAEACLREHESKVLLVVRHLMQHHYVDRVAFEAMMQEP